MNKTYHNGIQNRRWFGKFAIRILKRTSKVGIRATFLNIVGVSLNNLNSPKNPN